MRVTFFSSSFPSHEGDFNGKFVFELARELTREGLDVTAIAPTKRGAESQCAIDGVKVRRYNYAYPRRWQNLFDGTDGVPAKVSATNAKFLYQTAGNLSALVRNWIRQARESQTDIIHVHWPFPNGIGALIKEFPSVATLYGAEVFLSRRYGFGRVLCRILHRHQVVTAISRGTREAVCGLGFRKEIQIVPAGINPQIFRKIDVREPIEPTKYLIVALGRLVERKGFVFLVRAMPAILAEIPHAILYIAGEGPERAPLEREIAQLGLEEKVKLIGAISTPQVVELFNSADICVAPSIVDARGDTEGMGMTPLEALLCQTAVIGSNVGGIPDAVRHEETGLLVEPGDPGHLSAAAIRLYRDPDLRERLIRNGIRMVNQEYTNNAVAQKFILIYENILRRARQNRKNHSALR